jgi:hypothetical protein
MIRERRPLRMPSRQAVRKGEIGVLPNAGEQRRATSDGPARRQPGGVGARLALLAVPVVLAGYAWLVAVSGIRDDSDWSHLWIGGRMVATGCSERLYDPAAQVQAYRSADPLGRPPAVWRLRNERYGAFNYPPPAAVLYGLVAWLPMKSAGLVQASLTLLLVPLVACTLRAVSPGVGAAGAAVALLLHPAFFINLSLGQNALITVWVLAAAWALTARGRETWGGAVLGLLVAKPNIFAAALCVPLVLGRWRMVAAAAGGALLLCAGTAVITGWQPFLDYAGVIAGVSRMHELPGYGLDLQYSAAGLFRRWLGVGPGADALALITSAAVVLLTALAGWRCWRPGHEHFALLCGASLAAGLWVNPHLNHYDLLPLAAAFVLAMGEWRRTGTWGRLALVGTGALVYASLPWDASWPWSRILPVPGVAILALWLLLLGRMVAGVERERRELSRLDAPGCV